MGVSGLQPPTYELFSTCKIRSLEEEAPTVLNSLCMVAHLVPNTWHPQWEASAAREFRRGHVLGPRPLPRPLPRVGLQPSFSVMHIPWTCHKWQAEKSCLQCVFDHERSQKLGRSSPSFALYSPRPDPGDPGFPELGSLPHKGLQPARPW